MGLSICLSESKTNSCLQICLADQTSFLTVELIFCLDGNWGVWTSWGTCSASCEGGTQQRSRECDSPAPSFGGAACDGSISDSQNCGTQACAIGNWEQQLTNLSIDSKYGIMRISFK